MLPSPSHALSSPQMPLHPRHCVLSSPRMPLLSPQKPLSISQKLSSLPQMTFHSADGHSFRGEWSFSSREETFFYRLKPVNRRIIHVQRHTERVHSIITYSWRGIEHTQCRKRCSREPNGSCYPRIETVFTANSPPFTA